MDSLTLSPDWRFQFYMWKTSSFRCTECLSHFKEFNYIQPRRKSQPCGEGACVTQWSYEPCHTGIQGHQDTYGCENWTIKKAEGWRIDAFKLWCWRRLLRVLWTVRTSNHSILKEINPEYSLEWLMLKLKGAIEDEKVGWHQGLNGHEFEDTLGDS